MLLIKLKTTNRKGKLKEDVLITCNLTGRNLRICLKEAKRGQIILAFIEDNETDKQFYVSRTATILNNDGLYLTNEDKEYYENND